MELKHVSGSGTSIPFECDEKLYRPVLKRVLYKAVREEEPTRHCSILFSHAIELLDLKRKRMLIFISPFPIHLARLPGFFIQWQLFRSNTGFLTAGSPNLSARTSRPIPISSQSAALPPIFLSADLTLAFNDVVE